MPESICNGFAWIDSAPDWVLDIFDDIVARDATQVHSGMHGGHHAAEIRIVMLHEKPLLFCFDWGHGRAVLQVCLLLESHYRNSIAVDAAA